MELKQQVCNLDLSKRLEAVGYPQEALFYWKIDEGEPYLVAGNSRYMTSKGTIQAAAPTASELGEKLPAGALGAYLNIFKNVEGTWKVGYGLEKTITAPTLVDAMGEMVCYLAENKLIQL